MGRAGGPGLGPGREQWRGVARRAANGPRRPTLWRNALPRFEELFRGRLAVAISCHIAQGIQSPAGEFPAPRTRVFRLGKSQVAPRSTASGAEGREPGLGPRSKHSGALVPSARRCKPQSWVSLAVAESGEHSLGS